MESRSKPQEASRPVDRVLEALSPALAAELDRIIVEAREALEADFQLRLQQAIRETEAEVQARANADRERAVAEVGEAVRRQVTEELRSQLSEELKGKIAQLKAQFDEDFNASSANWEAERGRLNAELERQRRLGEFQAQAIEASTQVEILARFLKAAETFAAAVAVYVNKADGLALWKSRGETAAFPPVTSAETADSEFYFAPVVIRSKTVAAVCAAQPYDREVLDYLVRVMTKSIEYFGLRLRFSGSNPSASTGTAVGPPGQEELAEAASGSVEDRVNEEEQKLHTEARRHARLLVSEIKLYNEQQVKEGRAQSDLYQRLQKEIDRSRETYMQQVSRAVSARCDYFHEELVRILAENDPERLGKTYPGPIHS